MYPNNFEYHSTDSVSQAVNLLGENPDAKVIAGGHSLLPMIKSGLATPTMLVDIGDINELHGIDHNGDCSRIGAMTRYADVARSDKLWETVPTVAEAASRIGGIQVRNRGTVGGNIAHSDPAADLPAAVLAADATIHVHGPDGERTVAADDFFLGMFETAVDEREVVTAIDLPHSRVNTSGAYEKKSSPSSGYALVGVAACLAFDDDTVTDVRVSVNGVVGHATRLSAVEDALDGAIFDDLAVSTAGDLAGDSLEESMVIDDQQASPEFRLQLLSVCTEWALTTVGERANVL